MGLYNFDVTYRMNIRIFMSQSGDDIFLTYFQADKVNMILVLLILIIELLFLLQKMLCKAVQTTY